MGEVVTVPRHVAIDYKGNWSYHHGTEMVQYGYRAQMPVEEYLISLMRDYGEKPTHVLFWNPQDRTSVYTLSEWSEGDADVKTWRGIRLNIHIGPDGSYGMELSS